MVIGTSQSKLRFETYIQLPPFRFVQRRDLDIQVRDRGILILDRLYNVVERQLHRGPDHPLRSLAGSRHATILLLLLLLHAKGCFE